MPVPLVETITGVVLAGGKSSRMGTDKALARFGEETLVERCVLMLQHCFRRNILIANRAEPFACLKLPVFPDEIPDLGPLGGIYTALRHTDTPAIFVVACDMPFLSAELIRAMADALGEHDAVAAKPGGNFEPLHAVYHRRILPEVERRIRGSELSVNQLLRSLHVKEFGEPDLPGFASWTQVFLNVNTPAELRKAQSLTSGTKITVGRRTGL
jgi:molybdopterin-guanine dinucleotide biosynthesis protein A